MAKFIYKALYIKSSDTAAHRSNLVSYIATRDGAFTLSNSQEQLPANEKQKALIEQLEKDFPAVKQSFECQEYVANPTMGNAHRYISEAIEQNDDVCAGKESYIDYIANRPGVKNFGEHGLFNAEGKVENLSKVMKEVAEHNGTVWTPIISLKREDAERFGYDNVEQWQNLIISNLSTFAESYKIPLNKMHWYAATHEKPGHIHTHMVIYSTHTEDGFLSRQGLNNIRSALGKHIFRDDLLHVYERKSELRQEVGEVSAKRMMELINEMEKVNHKNPQFEELVFDLAGQLSRTKAKKVYGYLPPNVKKTVDKIVDEIAKDKNVAEAYAMWQDVQDLVCEPYSSQKPKRVPLSQQKDFKAVRNMVIKEVMKLVDKAETMPPEQALSEKNLMSSINKMFYRTGRIFRSNCTAPKVYQALNQGHITDEQRERRILAGHRIDDHEDERNSIKTVDEWQSFAM